MDYAQCMIIPNVTKYWDTCEKNFKVDKIIKNILLS